MGARQGRLKVVLDTNTVLSALVFSTGRLTWLREMWQQGHLGFALRDLDPATPSEASRRVIAPPYSSASTSPSTMPTSAA